MTYDYYRNEGRVDAANSICLQLFALGDGGERFDVLTEMGTDLFIAGSDGNYKASFNYVWNAAESGFEYIGQDVENHYKRYRYMAYRPGRIVNSELSESDKAAKSVCGKCRLFAAFLYFDLRSRSDVFRW